MRKRVKLNLNNHGRKINFTLLFSGHVDESSQGLLALIKKEMKPSTRHLRGNWLGMISHKKTLISIFGHKHKIKNFIKKFDIFNKEISTAFDFGLYFE